MTSDSSYQYLFFVNLCAPLRVPCGSSGENGQHYAMRYPVDDDNGDQCMPLTGSGLRHISIQTSE